MSFVFIIDQVKHIEIIDRMPPWTYPTLAKQNQSNKCQYNLASEEEEESQSPQFILIQKITCKTTMVPIAAAT